MGLKLEQGCGSGSGGSYGSGSEGSYGSGSEVRIDPVYENLGSRFFIINGFTKYGDILFLMKD